MSKWFHKLTLVLGLGAGAHRAAIFFECFKSGPSQAKEERETKNKKTKKQETFNAIFTTSHQHEEFISMYWFIHSTLIKLLS